MKELLIANKKKIVALIVAALVGLGIVISPELGSVIAEALDASEQVVRGISEAPVVE